MLSKVIVYKSCGEPFSWHRIWYLGWFWGRLAIQGSSPSVRANFSISEFSYFFIRFYYRAIKKPWLYSRWGFRDTFHKSAFHVKWSGNTLKLPMGNTFWVAELFCSWFRAIFLKISQMQWNLDFFAILAKYVAGVAKK